MEHLIQNQELLLIASAIVILLIAIVLIAMLSYKFKKYAEYTNETFEEHVKTFQEQWKDIEKLRKNQNILDQHVLKFHKVLYEPLYEKGNIVDFTDIDSSKTLTGKILSIHAGPNDEAKYDVEVESGVIFIVPQSQITAWTN
jgi:hypothetical protein